MPLLSKTYPRSDPTGGLYRFIYPDLYRVEIDSSRDYSKYQVIEIMESRIIYIERKAGQLTGEARIGRVTFSKTGRTIYYQDKTFRSLNGRGFKSNYIEIHSGDDYWISGPKKDGLDRLYGERTPVRIDEDIRVEYWIKIRNLPTDTHKKAANL